MLRADQLLARVQAAVPKVTGLRIVDETDPDTWSIDGLITGAERAAAIAILREGVTPATPVSTFFPPVPSTLERDVAALKRAVGVS